MKNLRAILVVSGALVAATSLYGSVANAQSASIKSCMAGGVTEAECACEAALEKGTRQAIRSFLRNYRGQGTACGATAFTGTSGNTHDNDRSTNRYTRPSQPSQTPKDYCKYGYKHSS